MAFSFNFNISAQANQNSNNDSLDTTNNRRQAEVSREPSWRPDIRSSKVKEARVHKQGADVLSHVESAVTESVAVGGFAPLIYLSDAVFERGDAKQVLSQSITQNSDLISGVYEGGLKIWEGTHDLLGYVAEEAGGLSGKTVLDLGCGAGLLGILALKRGASKVHFQDYNSTVIEQLTIPNVFLNCEEGDGDGDKEDEGGSPALKRRTAEKSPTLPDGCGFFSGDWASFLALVRSLEPTLKYDVILTSETIYNTAHYQSLHDVFEKLLAEHGVVYLATKSHYFGVGGGLYLFERFVEDKNVFQVKSLKDFDQGLKRHVVSLRFKKSLS